ncbi:hypothetical protein [Alicyclobacillus sp. SO9]|uniref:hypothetical protein n=1 Tax=Alicyclobacillus sp. SO9 TaxID=2665646 RepID=UPI0018E859F5|nr:hypothetical protein [Alicyclobacillus sp. SO9]QQE77750.1 hypothetical protein GI364_17710 [Alicyclobacillus sp. SO9]
MRRPNKIVVTEVTYGKHPIQQLTQQMIELLVLNRYTLSNPIHPSHTKSVSGGKHL